MTKNEQVRQQFRSHIDSVLFDYSSRTGKWVRDAKLADELADTAMVVWKLFEEQDKIIREGNQNLEKLSYEAQGVIEALDKLNAQKNFHLMGTIYTNPREYTK